MDSISTIIKQEITEFDDNHNDWKFQDHMQDDGAFAYPVAALEGGIDDGELSDSEYEVNRYSTATGLKYKNVRYHSGRLKNGKDMDCPCGHFKCQRRKNGEKCTGIVEPRLKQNGKVHIHPIQEHSCGASFDEPFERKPKPIFHQNANVAVKRQKPGSMRKSVNEEAVELKPTPIFHQNVKVNVAGKRPKPDSTQKTVKKAVAKKPSATRSSKQKATKHGQNVNDLATNESNIEEIPVLAFTNQQLFDMKITDLSKLEILDGHGNPVPKVKVILLDNCHMLPSGEIQFEYPIDLSDQTDNANSIGKPIGGTELINADVVDQANIKEEYQEIAKYGEPMQNSHKLLLEKELRRVRSADIAVAKKATQAGPSTSKPFDLPTCFEDMLDSCQ